MARRVVYSGCRIVSRMRADKDIATGNQETFNGRKLRVIHEDDDSAQHYDDGDGHAHAARGIVHAVYSLNVSARPGPPREGAAFLLCFIQSIIDRARE